MHFGYKIFWNERDKTLRIMDARGERVYWDKKDDKKFVYLIRYSTDFDELVAIIAELYDLHIRKRKLEAKNSESLCYELTY